jgi:exopolysaccharide biosynthesis predicted pyruvyltransferase EpsI
MTELYEQSCFLRFMEKVAGRYTYFDEYPGGNNGDVIILKGNQHAMKKVGCKLVDSPGKAEQIVIRGGGVMVDIYQTDFKKLVEYREKYPSVPLIYGPSTFRFRGADFRKICEISSASPLILFARDHNSAQAVREINPPAHCEIHVSHDLAFELYDSDFIADLRRNCAEKHILIAMRKDKEGFAKVLTKTSGTWLPKSVRRPLSWVRDRLVAHVSQDIVETILKQEHVSDNLPRIYRDVACSLSFEEFVASIRDAALIVTNRLHVAVLGHLLNKRVVIICATEYHEHKIKGVYELSMSGPGSKTVLFIPSEIMQSSP